MVQSEPYKLSNKPKSPLKTKSHQRETSGSSIQVVEYSTGGAKEREGADTGGEEEQKRRISHR